MNPPFGTKPGNKGIDMVFLETGIELSKGAIYSFHKSSTRNYISKCAEKWKYSFEVIAQLKLEIKVLIL
ncbi:Methyltransferase-like protein 5 [Smittium culicis]|uniref:Methyltransferase-like protein 5 n=1 Tax=Smittium culicis TaxID=133412 RepID=A0A1R1Y1C7_9FUNG|nr:Methyltransferase-like protein 5 [Smittium culicis]